jgi:hypothetical protein
MTMPEASVNKDNSLPLGQHDIRPARQVTYVQPEPIAHAMECGTNQQFRLCVLAANPTHIPAAAFFCESVDHE